MRWLGRLWRWLFAPPQPSFNLEIRVLSAEGYWRWRDHEAGVRLRRAGEAFAAAVISALEEES